MLSLDAFLMRIWPSRGDLVVVQLSSGPDGKPTPVNHPFSNTDRTQITTYIRALEQQRANIYIALAGYALGKIKSRQGRRQENAEWFRSLWLDIDCGPGKDYASQKDAAAALQSFINDAGLPAPLIVGSGGGLHVYWPFDIDIDLATWKPLAQGLKDLCVMKGLKIDPACTADAARILRPIETSNWKTGSARAVRVIVDSPASSPAILQSLLIRNNTVQQLAHPKLNGNNYQHPAGYGLDAVDHASPSQFDGEKILAGCQQMQWAMRNANDVKEPMWREIVGTLYKTNAPHLIHEVSKDYASYSYAETEKKAQGWQGRSVLCTKLEEYHTGGCAGCKHLGVVTSPSAIGFTQSEIPEIKIDPATELPQGWFLKDGALWTSNDEGDVQLYHGNIDIGVPYREQNQTRAPIETTANGVKTRHFINYGDTHTAKDFVKALNNCNIVFDRRNERIVTAGMRSWLLAAHSKSKITTAHVQLGWTTTAAYTFDASYVLGDYVYRPDGTQELVRLIEQAKGIGHAIHAHGSLQEWQQAFNLLALPGYEAHMVASWIAFAAPLIRFDNTAPAMVHFYSQQTGQGKTTLLNYINSVFGDPDDAGLFWTGNTTPITVQTGLTILNGLAMGIDEITLQGFESSRRLLYECTQQTGRKRSKQDGTLQKANMTKTMLYSTGNASLQSIASNMQLDDTPLQSRLVELPIAIPSMTPTERAARHLLIGSVKTNFGHAAPIYISYVVRNQEKVARLLAQVRVKLEQAIDFKSEDRYQITSMSAMIAGASVARKLKLIDHPVDVGIQWIVDWFGQQRIERLTTANTPSGLLERLISDLQANTVVVNTYAPTNAPNSIGINMVDTVRAPVREVRCRRVEQNQELYIDRNSVRQWLTSQRLDPKATLDQWKKLHLLVQESHIDPGIYTRYALGARLHMYKFDLSKLP